jgi:hypothetical protein
VNVARRSVDEFKEDLVSEEEDGREPEADRELEESVGREEDTAFDRNPERQEQL